MQDSFLLCYTTLFHKGETMKTIIILLLSFSTFSLVFAELDVYESESTTLKEGVRICVNADLEEDSYCGNIEGFLQREEVNRESRESLEKLVENKTYKFEIEVDNTGCSGCPPSYVVDLLDVYGSDTIEYWMIVDTNFDNFITKTFINHLILLTSISVVIFGLILFFYKEPAQQNNQKVMQK